MDQGLYNNNKMNNEFFDEMIITFGLMSRNKCPVLR